MLNNLSDNICPSKYFLLSNTYIGNKGYTIYKKELTLAQQKLLRNELTITPRTHGAPITNNLHSYPVYRESENKFYVPHYYGTKYFGVPNSIQITNGDDINFKYRAVKGYLSAYTAVALATSSSVETSPVLPSI